MDKGYTPRLKEHYLKTLPKLTAELQVNVHEVPRVEKVVVNVGVGRMLAADSKSIDYVTSSLAAITGQHPVKTYARQAIAGFKIREGQPVGVMVSLRGAKMYEFLDRLISTALPRVRDFRGLKTEAFAGGSYTLGLADHTVFPEIAFESGRSPFGLEITVVTSADSSERARMLLTNLGFPFKKEEK